MIVMVGGSTRIPAVLELVKRTTGKDPNQTRRHWGVERLSRPGGGAIAGVLIGHGRTLSPVHGLHNGD